MLTRAVAQLAFWIIYTLFTDCLDSGVLIDLVKKKRSCVSLAM